MMRPVPMVLRAVRGKWKGLFTSEVSSLLGVGMKPDVSVTTMAASSSGCEWTYPGMGA